MTIFYWRHLFCTGLAWPKSAGVRISSFRVVLELTPFQVEFNVVHVSEIKWNDKGFEDIVIDQSRKMLIQSLVESHAQGHPFDDFVEGKGRGLVINLYGELAAANLSQFLTSPSYRAARCR